MGKDKGQNIREMGREQSDRDRINKRRRKNSERDTERKCGGKGNIGKETKEGGGH